MAFDEDWDPDAPDEQEYFDAKEACKHLLIIRAFDAPRYYRTENNQDGLVWPNKSRGQNFKPFPNMVVRAAVADLDAEGGPKIYPDAVLFPSSITKIAKAWVGKGPQLLMWRKGPNQTDSYELRNMRGDEDAVKVGTQFLDEHPEFLALPAPEPYDESPPEPEDNRRDYEDRRRYDREYVGGDTERRERARAEDDWGRQSRRDDRRDRGYDDRRDSRDDGWGRDDRGRSNGRDDRGARDWGQHDDRGRRDDRRRDTYADDPWARETRESRGDGSFMSRSADSARRGFQDEEPPF